VALGSAATVTASDAFRVLVVDDNEHIHVAFARLLGRRAFVEERARAFGDVVPVLDDAFELDFALDGPKGIKKVETARAESRPFAIAFMDVGMPGMDGIEALGRIWSIDPSIQAVVCTGTRDDGWRNRLCALGDMRDRLLVLRKPFDPIEAQQMAHMLARKWSFETRRRRVAP
jgi:CheY-like chemotaxis protein